MDIPYGFDCYTFQKEEIKFFESNIFSVKRSILSSNAPKSNNYRGESVRNESALIANMRALAEAAEPSGHVKFTRKNEDYPKEQVLALGYANRLNLSEIDKRIFCGIKIQLGIGVVTSFLRKGLQYKPPIRGRSELVNGTWTGIMKGLTVSRDSPSSYDLAFGNFLAWDEEFPYIKFGPFFAIESKLVMLTGSSRQIEASSFGTNIRREIWLTILCSLFLVSILASLRIHWQASKYHQLERALDQMRAINNEQLFLQSASRANSSKEQEDLDREPKSMLNILFHFLFIYITMLLNKPSHEFDDLIWPRVEQTNKRRAERRIGQLNLRSIQDKQLNGVRHLKSEAEMWPRALAKNKELRRLAAKLNRWKMRKLEGESELPTSIRILSYMWSAACLVIASIYSGEMLAVMLLHADTNVDTIPQLINSKPAIEPVIRQDDFTYNLMLKSLDENMLKLYYKTRIIPRQEVYTRQFIESVSQRKVALLGDDELIETIYDLYHKYYPLHKSKMTYLQYPISIMYRRDFDQGLEVKLNRGLVQMFEMGLVHRWYQAQKDTYIQFYDRYERKANEKSATSTAAQADFSSDSAQNYKPLSLAQFESFFKAMIWCIIFSCAVLIAEIVHYKVIISIDKGR